MDVRSFFGGASSSKSTDVPSSSEHVIDSNQSDTDSSECLESSSAKKRIEAVGLLAEECLLKRLHQASNLSIMVDECTDVTTIEELSIFYRWIEDGQSVEHFLEIVPFKATDAKTIYSAFNEVMKDKNMHISKFVFMGFDGAGTFFLHMFACPELIEKLEDRREDLWHIGHIWPGSDKHKSWRKIHTSDEVMT